jgi:DNA-binding NtrC family response regulator
MEGVRAPLHEEAAWTERAHPEVNTLIRRLAASELTVLITGESGTGKDIAARLASQAVAAVW